MIRLFLKSISLITIYSKAIRCLKQSKTETITPYILRALNIIIINGIVHITLIKKLYIAKKIIITKNRT